MPGCISPFDRWMVKIKAPSDHDGVHDPASFCCQKGYYGLNVPSYHNMSDTTILSKS